MAYSRKEKEMILNTGQRTDIPAFYSDWLINRIRAGFVLVRNPWYPQQVTRYRIDPSVVDLIAFCSKNPAPELARKNMKDHDPASPFLIGHAMPGDIIHEARQTRWFTGQTVMVPFL